MQFQTNGFPLPKLRVVSSQKQIAIRTITRLHFIVTRTTNASSISSGSLRGSTQWSSARARFSDRQRSHTNRPEHRDQSVRIYIVYFNVRFELQNRFARTETLRVARRRSVPSRSN